MSLAVSEPAFCALSVAAAVVRASSELKAPQESHPRAANQRTHDAGQRATVRRPRCWLPPYPVASLPTTRSRCGVEFLLLRDESRAVRRLSAHRSAPSATVD